MLAVLQALHSSSSTRTEADLSSMSVVKDTLCVCLLGADHAWLGSMAVAWLLEQPSSHAGYASACSGFGALSDPDVRQG